MKDHGMRKLFVASLVSLTIAGCASVDYSKVCRTDEGVLVVEGTKYKGKMCVKPFVVTPSKGWKLEWQS